MSRTLDEYPFSSHPSCEEVKELLPPAAVGALDRADASVVARHLLLCRDCRQELDRYSDTIDFIGFAAPQITPPPSLRRAILGRLSLDEPRTPARRMPGWRWVATIAASLIALLLAGNLALQLHPLTSAPASSPTVTLTSSAPARPLVWYDLTAAAPDAGSARGFVCAQEEGNLAWLIVQDLPQLPSGKTYQAWLMSGDQRVSAGTFTVDPLGRGFLTIRLKHPIESYSILGVTDEPDGGSPVPTGERLLSARL